MDRRPISRRDFLRTSALFAGGMTLLTACGGQPAAPAAPAKPAESKPVETKPAAQTAPTTAPAAKPADSKPGDAAKRPRLASRFRRSRPRAG